MQVKESTASKSNNTLNIKRVDFAALLNDESEELRPDAPKPNDSSANANGMQPFESETDSIRNVRERNRQCEA